MSFLDTAGTKITYEVKTIIGVIGILIGFMLFIINSYIGIGMLIKILIPSIVLIIPNEKVKNNRILGIILILIFLFGIVILMNAYTKVPYPHYVPKGDSVLAMWSLGEYAAQMEYYQKMSSAILYSILICIYNLFCAFLLLIKSEHKQWRLVKGKNIIHQLNNKVNMQDNNKSYCSECGGILVEDSKFCPSCGVKIEEKTNTLHCPECGVILTEDFKFCPSCGSKLMNQKVLNEDNLQKQDSDKTNSDNDEKKLE